MDKTWKVIDKYGEPVDEENENGVHLVSICALAPTIPRTLVPGVGWNSQATGKYDESGDDEGGGDDSTSK
jgi:hypothetical protein